MAIDALSSSIDYRIGDVETLDPAVLGSFDTILFVNVLYHIVNPMRALRALVSVAKPGATMILKTYYRTDVRFWVKGRCLGFDIDRRPKWWYFPTTELAGDPTNWWAPNRSGLEAGLSSSGWSNFTHIGTWRDRLYYHAVRDE